MISTKYPITLEEVYNTDRSVDYAPLKGIKHSLILEVFIKKCAKRKWKLTNFKGHLSEDKRDLVCTWDVDVPKTSLYRGSTFSLGLMNLNDQMSAIRMFGGWRMTDDDSGIVFVDYHTGKHTNKLLSKLERKMSSRLEYFLEDLKEFNEIRYKMEKNGLLLSPPNDEVMNLLIHSCRNRWLSWSKLGIIDRSLKGIEPITYWLLLRAYSLAVKRGPVFRQLPSLVKFFRLLWNYLDKEGLASYNKQGRKKRHKPTYLG